MFLLCVSTCTRSSSGRDVQGHTGTANCVEVPPTWLDLYKFINRGNYSKAYRNVKCRDGGNLKWFMWSDVVMKISEVMWSESVKLLSMYIRVTLYCRHLIILWLCHLGKPCTVFVLICTVVVSYCFVMCVCVCVWMCVCVCVWILKWLRFFLICVGIFLKTEVFLTWLRVFTPWLRFFRAFSSVVRQMPGCNSHC
jgi:hypothetical protein